MPLEVGDPVPDVRAQNQHGETVEPDFDGLTVVYFYPKDKTPGCTTEAEQFNLEHETYRDAGVTVYGVSTDSVDDHASFANDEGLQFDLLADPEGKLCEAFGVPVENGAAKRMTFVVDDGTVDEVYSSVKPDGHARTVLMDLLQSGRVEL